MFEFALQFENDSMRGNDRLVEFFLRVLSTREAIKRTYCIVLYENYEIEFFFHYYCTVDCL